MTNVTNVEHAPPGRKRILHLRIKARSADVNELLSFLKTAVPFYEAPGGIRVRLLQRVDDPSRFLEVIEYDNWDAFDKDQQRVANDSQMRGYLQKWRSLLAEGAEVEIYEDITSNI